MKLKWKWDEDREKREDSRQKTDLPALALAEEGDRMNMTENR
jgi:hypothetical protein